MSMMLAQALLHACGGFKFFQELQQAWLSRHAVELQDPIEPCAQYLQAVPSFDPETSTIHMGQGTDTERFAGHFTACPQWDVK